MIRFGRAKFGIIALVGFLMLLISPAIARADNVVEGFYEKGQLKIGQIVKLSTKQQATVEIAPANSSNEIFGVIVDPSNSPITLERTSQQVFVATGGSYPVFVSNAGGPITKGDYISVSQLDGVGSKASGNQPVILGHAETGFDGVHNVTSRSGKYAIGEINVAIAVAPSPLFKNTLAIPQPLQKIGNSVAGREVSPFRVYTALLLFLVSNSMAIISLVVGTRTSLVALGRNPLGQHTILRGLYQVIGACVAIFAISVVGVYLLLRI